MSHVQNGSFCTNPRRTAILAGDNYFTVPLGGSQGVTRTPRHIGHRKSGLATT